MMGISRQCTALASFEVHQVIAEGAALQRQPSLVTLLEGLQVDTKTGICGLSPSDRLEYQIQRYATINSLDRTGDVGEHASLGRNLETLDYAVEHFQHFADGGNAIGGRVDPDHGVAITVHQPIENARRDPRRFVGRVVGLQARRKTAAQAKGVAKTGDHANLLCDQHQVLHAHYFRNGSDHFGRQSWGERTQAVLIGGIAQQPVTKAADSQMTDWRKGLFVVCINDQPGDFVALVGNQYFLQEMLEFDIGQGHLRRNTLTIVECCHARKHVSGAGRTGFRHDLFEAFKAEVFGAD
ncbi:hypothetical protein WR25_17886 [Diploscapter pachys]|uniref:Uncharacterized protein n=1 Tax=Diploscapter pachys TaxID=2018661 RepID=A0A2A2JZ38_9BILA|nr:hypothetical protein WR25_17886 [Diploscapter pachys]